MQLLTFVPPDGQPRAGALLGEAVVDLAAGAPLVFEDAEQMRWDMLSILQGGESLEESSSLDAAADILAAVVDMLGDSADELAAGAALPGNGSHNAGLAGNVSIGGVEMLLPLAQVRLLAPLPRPASLRLFAAFADVALPAFAFGNHGAIYGPDAAVPMPQAETLAYGLELGCVIGRTGRDIAPDEALDYIAGYTIINNWTARDAFADDEAGGFADAKASDFATSMGPWLVTPDELELYTEDDGHLNLVMLARVNRVEHLRDTASRMRFPFAQMIAYASRDATLYPGDVLCSGAPPGAAYPLSPGDSLELEITGLGVLRSQIVQA